MPVSGKPVSILTLNPDDSFTLDEAALRTVLTHADIKDKPVCLVPVAGAFRKGKSFLLNFMLRYLDAGGSENWLKDTESDALEGFHWCGGSQRDTTGILIWSKVFTLTTESGQEVAVVLMDTQGAFDRKTSLKATIMVFALSLMTSSTFIYNLDENIQEDDLQHLQFFTNFGKLALDESGDAPFQKLVFLLRDWQFPYEKPFGAEGGRQLLETALEVNDEQPEELQTVRKDLTSCFDKMECFLLPYPGRGVTNPAFTGLAVDMDSEFVEHLKMFLPTIMSPKSLSVKMAAGREVRCKDMVHYFKLYMEILSADEMPEPKTMLNATIEANNVVSMAAAREMYEEKMEEVVGGDMPYLNSQDIDEHHLRILDLAMEEFDRMKKMGGDEYSTKYREQLMEEIEETFNQYKAHNESKNIMNIAGTPLTLAFLWICLYLLAQVAALLLLGPVIAVAQYLQLATVLTGSAWGYTKYSGKFPTVGVTIDGWTARIWEMLVQPMVGKVIQNYVSGK